MELGGVGMPVIVAAVVIVVVVAVVFAKSEFIVVGEDSLGGVVLV